MHDARKRYEMVSGEKGVKKSILDFIEIMFLNYLVIFK